MSNGKPLPNLWNPELDMPSSSSKAPLASAHTVADMLGTLATDDETFEHAIGVAETAGLDVDLLQDNDSGLRVRKITHDNVDDSILIISGSKQDIDDIVSGLASNDDGTGIEDVIDEYMGKVNTALGIIVNRGANYMVVEDMFESDLLPRNIHVHTTISSRTK